MVLSPHIHSHEENSVQSMDPALFPPPLLQDSAQTGDPEVVDSLSGYDYKM